MSFIFIIGYLLITFAFIIININKSKANSAYNENKELENKKFDFKKLIYGVVLFVPIFITYYFLITLIASILLMYNGGAESGAWAYALILGIGGSPILTIITIIKIFSKK